MGSSELGHAQSGAGCHEGAAIEGGRGGLLLQFEAIQKSMIQRSQGFGAHGPVQGRGRARQAGGCGLAWRSVSGEMSSERNQ